MSWPVAGQVTRDSHLLDSLHHLAYTPAVPDTQRVDALKLLCWYYKQLNLDTATHYGEQALQLARRARYLRGELATLSELSSAVVSNQDYVRGEQLAQELSRRASMAPQSLVRFRAIAFARLADVATEQGDYVRATNYYRKKLAIVLHEQPMPPQLLLETYIELASAYTNQLIGDGPHADSTVVLGMRYARQAVRLVRQAGQPLQEATGLMALSAGTWHREQWDTTRVLLRQAQALYQAAGAINSEAMAIQQLADLEVRTQHFALAEQLARRAYDIQRELSDAAGQYQSLDILAKALAAQGKGGQAYVAARTARQLRDSLTDEQNQADLAKLQVRFDTQKKESRIRELSQQQQVQLAAAQRQRQRLWTLAVVLIAVLLGLGVALALYQRLRRSRAQLADQNQLLAIQRDELAQARATQDRLYALIAHDLRSPVVAFTGLADLLNRYVAKQDTERLAGLGDRIRQAAQNLSELLDNLLNWAVNQRGELTPQFRPLRAHELLTNIAALYQNAATAADVTLTVDAPDAEMLVQADPDMTRTILRNLAGNALKATPAGGTVALCADRDAAGRARLRVVDSGPGLPAETRARLNLAAPDLRVAGKDSGAGLGLLLSRSFAEAQGGSLVLGAAATGGAEATLTLPLAT